MTNNCIFNFKRENVLSYIAEMNSLVLKFNENKLFRMVPPRMYFLKSHKSVVSPFMRQRDVEKPSQPQRVLRQAYFQVCDITKHFSTHAT